MTLKYVPLFLSMQLVAAIACAQTGPALIADNAAIRAILVDRIDVRHQAVGIVVGVIDSKGRRVVSYGHFDSKDPRVPDGNTLFEIGSVTKVFTSLLLADAVQRGEVSLSDPVSKFLPAEVRVPERGGKKITLLDLATHTSGLPRLPSNFSPHDASNPYADYSVKQLYEFLSTYELPRDIGSQYDYSNFGVGLLGHALARKIGVDYPTLVRDRITEPLGMKSTSIALSAEQQKRLAPGHDASGARVPNWDLPTLAGAGAVRSTADDLLTFLAANLGLSTTPLAEAMRAQLAVRRPTTSPNLEIALGWHVLHTAAGNEMIWHNGGTGGYRSFLAFDLKKRSGVVVLSNTFTDVGVDDIGRHLLDPASALLEAPRERKEIKVNPALFDNYVGRYELAPGFVLTVTREGDHLFGQATGQPRFELFPESDRSFFLRVVDAQVTFQLGAKGRATSLILHQNGADAPAKWIEGEGVASKEVGIEAGTLELYVGRYQMNPNFILTITRQENHLYVQATGQPRLELFARGPREFFLKVVDAQITFEVTSEGRVSGLVLHQNGMKQRAERM